jgi:hypothetical protein
MVPAHGAASGIGNASRRWRLDRQEARYGLTLGLIFVWSRCLAYMVGLRFDLQPLFTYWQLLDPQILQGDLVRGLLYLHSQPPLFNAGLGILLKVQGADPGLGLQVCYFLASALYTGLVYALMRRVGVSGWLAVAVTSLLVVRPAHLLLENWLMYDLPVALLVVLAAWCLAQAVAKPSSAVERSGESVSQRGGRPVWWHAFFWVLFVLCATRSLFHPAVLWLAAVWVWRSKWLPGNSRQRWVAALAPLLLISGLQLKNLTLFGTSSTSSWLGMSAARITMAALPASQATALVQQGSLRLADVQPFSPLEDYPARYLETAESTPGLQHPALRAVRKTSGAPNYNHLAYLEIARDSLHDGLWIVRHRPLVYLEGMAKAWYNYFQPPSKIEHLEAARGSLGRYAEIWERVVYGSVPTPFSYRGERRSLNLFATLGLPLLWLLGWKEMRRSRAEGTAVARAVFLFLCSVVLYVALVGNSLEVWENQRFRFYTDSGFAIFAACGLQRLAARWARNRR